MFVGALLAFAYFHQGGGWGQNARFALVRSIVEEGRFAIDSYLVYRGSRGPGDSARLLRLPVRNGEFSFDGKVYAVGWRDAEGQLIPVASSVTAGATVVPIDTVAASEDVSFHGGHFHPNKAPGTSFLAVPGYFAIYWLERLAGNDPDDWWRLTVNAWLTSVLSVGVLSAFGCVLFLRLSGMVWEAQLVPALLTTFVFAYGTMFLPYATMLSEHDVVAVAFIASVYFLWLAKTGETSGPVGGQPWSYILSAGLCAGYAAITNYIAVAVVAVIAVYVVWGLRTKGGWLWYGLGVSGPLLLLLVYQYVCFGTPFATNYASESPMFRSSGAALGVFALPRADVLLVICFSPFRGLFFSSPVLLMGLAGMGRLFRWNRRRAEAALFAAIIAFFVLFNISFNGWHGGWATGPRYLVPAVPFLALATVFGFERYFKLTCLLAVVSIVITLLFTSVDPQSPLGVHRIALVPGRAQWSYNPLAEYEAPLFFTGQAKPILRGRLQATLDELDRGMSAQGLAPSERAGRLDAARRKIDDEIKAGDPSTFLLASMQGPVSVNPIGVYEGWFYRVFPPDSEESRWNSFNAGRVSLCGKPLEHRPAVARMRSVCEACRAHGS